MIYLSFWLHYVYVIFTICLLTKYQNYHSICKVINHSVYVLTIISRLRLVYLFHNGYRPSIIFFLNPNVSTHLSNCLITISQNR